MFMNQSVARARRVGVRNRRVRQLLLVAAFAGLFLLLHFASGQKFLTALNVRTVLMQSAFPALVAWGMMFIFTTGMIDLSIGANIILSANVGALCAQYLGMGYFGLFVPTILCAVACELLVTHSAVTLKIPSWIAGLCFALIFESALNTFTANVRVVSGTNLIPLTDYRLFGKPWVMIGVAVAALAVAYILFERTTIGMNLQAVGSNPDVAKAMGINLRRTIVLGAVIGGIFIGLSAIIDVSYLGKVFPSSGLGSLQTIFRSLATVLLAQSFARIIPMPVGILISSVVVVGIFNVLTLLGVPSGTWQEILLGVIVIVCGIASNVRKRGVVK